MTSQPLPFTENYDSLAAALPGADQDWLESLRRDALERYRAAGLPTAKTEAWRYTNLNRLRRAGFVAAPAPKDATVPVGAALAVDAYCAVLVNGRFRPDLSSLDDLPDGLTIAGIAETLERDPAAVEPLLGRLQDTTDVPLAALNTAHLADGVFIRFAKGKAIDKPVHVISLGAAADTPALFHPRLLVVTEAGSQGCVLESHVGDGTAPYFSNIVSEVRVAEGAMLRHCKLQNEHPAAFHIAASHVALAARGTYENFVLQTGGRLARNEIAVRIDGEHAEARLDGAYLLRGDQHADNTTLLDHAAPGSTSRELYQGVIDGRARGVFQGKILVRRGAQKSDGHQLNKALLLSREAEIDSKPELEIYADDVKCAHGATAGELDEDALFYLQSRGIDPETAQALLVEAFVAEPIERIMHDGAREAFAATVAGWLAEARRGREKEQAT
jgi:Fe-S cluster assembly protein SufD